MKLNNLTKALVVAVALLGVVPVQAKSEIYVTENDNAPIEYVEQVSPNETIEYEVVEQVVPRKTYRSKSNKKQYYKTYYVKEATPMGDAANTVAYVARVGALGAVAYFTFGLASKLLFGAATALSLL